MGFSRHEYWGELPCPPPGDLPDPGIKPRSPELQADSLLSEPAGKPETSVTLYNKTDVSLLLCCPGNSLQELQFN